MKMNGPARKKNKGLVVGFDEEARREFLTGFRKRKQERQKEGKRKQDVKMRQKKLEERAARRLQVKIAMGVVRPEEEEEGEEQEEGEKEEEREEAAETAEGVLEKGVADTGDSNQQNSAALTDGVHVFEEPEATTVVTVSTDFDQLDHLSSWDGVRRRGKKQPQTEKPKIKKISRKSSRPYQKKTKKSNTATRKRSRQ